MAPTGWVSLPEQFEGGRSAEEIRKFWQNWEHPSINKQEWSGQEVDQLKAIAAQHGHLQWQKIAKELGVRTGGASGAGLGGWAGLGLPRATGHSPALGAHRFLHPAALEDSLSTALWTESLEAYGSSASGLRVLTCPPPPSQGLSLASFWSLPRFYPAQELVLMGSQRNAFPSFLWALMLFLR